MLDVRSLTKSYASGKRGSSTPAGGVQDVSLSVQKGTFFTLLGPSGCGKTTTLRCIAGLELPDSGVISIDGATVFDDREGIVVPVNQRDIGMVFQSYAVWPHMTVFENVAFPLRVGRRNRVREAEIAAKVQAALRTVGLDGYGARSSTQLSGGQQQRLALARAIIHEPGLLLLDEPLSNLDVKLREEMRIELKRLQTEAGLTAIYVTHDQAEALAMSDTIAVMERGRVAQCGTPHEIYHTPASRFVAGFVGAANLVEADLLGPGRMSGFSAARLHDGSVIDCTRAAGLLPGPVCVCVRPEAIRLQADPASTGSPDNSLPGRVAARIFLGNTTMFHVATGGTVLQVMAGPGDDYAPDTDVTVRFSPAGTIALAA